MIQVEVSLYKWSLKSMMSVCVCPSVLKKDTPKDIIKVRVRFRARVRQSLSQSQTESESELRSRLFRVSQSESRLRSFRVRI